MNLLRERGLASSRPGGTRGRRACRPRGEGLEARELLATVSVNAGQVVRAVDTNLLGVNLVNWDSNLNTGQTTQMVQAAGLTEFRFPGGSASDDFHFNSPPSYNGQGTDTSMASFIASVNGQAIITLDYGSGSPQEAAALLAYFNGSTSNTTMIGNGQEWNDTANAWQAVNWQAAGYWAGLRAAAPLAHDDGLNFLRMNHPAPFGFHYWEVGNEEYGSWEVDHHSVQHDPTTYVTFAKQFQNYAASIAPGISIGIDAGDPTAFNNWVGNVLTQSVSQGLSVGFISDHNYTQAPGGESDSTLLLHTVSDPSSSDDWATRASGYESLLAKDLGASAARNVELMATEFNSVYSNPGKQTTSLVNGLFVADALGSLLETPYDGADVWDLRNYYDNSNNNSSSLYGWRQAGDYGIIGSPNGSAPASGTYVPYPTYFAEQLASKIIQGGGQVVQATSSDPALSTYAVLEPNGHLDLLVINKSPSGALSGQFQLSGFVPSGQAGVWQYGEAQDTAQGQTTNGASSLANSSQSLTTSGSNFSDSFPAYSMTVLDLTPATGPTIVTPAGATPNPVNGTTTDLTVQATDPAGASGLAYTWATTGTPPAPVTFSINGTNAASSTIATFTQVGTYSFQVTVRDPGGLTATSSTTVVVNSLGVIPTVGDAGFEAIPVGNGYAYDPTGSAWAFSGTPGNGSGVSGNGSAFTSGNPPAPQGSQVAFLQGQATITQSVSGWAAGTYTLSFDAARRGNFGSSMENFEVLVDGSVVGSFTPSGTSYQPYTTSTFTVPAGSNSIEFLGLDSGGGDNTTFLDAVSVATSTPPAVPAVGDAGFETIPVGNGYAYNAPGSAWTFSHLPSGYGSGVAGNNSAFTSGNPPAPQGTQVAFLQGNGTITQLVAGWAAGTYTLSFDTAQRGNYITSTENFEILVDGSIVGTFTPSGTSYEGYTTAAFTVAAGAHTIEFLGLDGGGGDNTALLDAVSVATATPPIVPTVGDSGFEAVNVGGGYQYNPTGSAWAFSGSPGNGSGVAGNGSAFTSGNPAAPQGSQVAFLQGQASITQTVAGWAAGTYAISFEAARRGNYGGVEDFEVLVDGNVVGTFKPSTTSYQAYTTSTFTVSAGSHVIQLVGINTAGGDDTDFIDSVSIA